MSKHLIHLDYHFEEKVANYFKICIHNVYEKLSGICGH